MQENRKENITMNKASKLRIAKMYNKRTIANWVKRMYKNANSVLTQPKLIILPNGDVHNKI